MKYFLITCTLLMSLTSQAAYLGRNADIVVGQDCGSSYPGHLKLRSLAKKQIKEACAEIGASAKDIDMYLLGVSETTSNGEKCRKHAYEVKFVCE